MTLKKPLKKDVDEFRIKLEECINSIILIDKKNESEERLKSPIKTFLSSSFYTENEINTRERVDLATHPVKDNPDKTVKIFSNRIGFIYEVRFYILIKFLIPKI